MLARFGTDLVSQMLCDRWRQPTTWPGRFPSCWIPPTLRRPPIRTNVIGLYRPRPCAVPRRSSLSRAQRRKPHAASRRNTHGQGASPLRRGSSRSCKPCDVSSARWGRGDG
ncbi:hypothetical protein GSI_15162 [Ganoderma sinense ZZ0214-1]|uniref:Uncharacterized protein n=1 Tax=Ganoderma sinense ZZ0214-1 TaxID=1077348 RepID=A0A2G8RLT0_9APHY|nr:hypothetical protein GSI_15162 [Ganoderma sinense ZZ0214-1]